MLKLSAKDFNEIRQWMYRNARHLELTLWQYEFENGDKDAVLDALAFYQNEDGGFGNTLEPDSWNPNSTPYTTSIAIDILKPIGFADVRHPVISGIFKFLDSGKYFSEDGWHWSIPTNDDYPRAPWWNFSEPWGSNFEPDNATGDDGQFGLTAEIISSILRIAEKDSSLYKKSLALAEKIIEIPKKSVEHDDQGGNVSAMCMLLETLQHLGLMDKLGANFLPEAVKKMVAHSIVMDSSKWHEYGGWPSNYVETPDSMFYSGYKDIVQQELDYLIKTRPEQDVWGISWSWYENAEKYAKAWAISENWWKGFHVIRKMRFLKNFDRLER